MLVLVVLRRLFPAGPTLLIGRALVLMMAVGVLATLDEHHYLWAVRFAASGS